MTEAQNYAIRLMASQKRTTHVVDRAAQVMMIRSARNEDERNFIIRTILDERAEWKRYLQRQQRAWQSRCSRRVVRNNHHDSWAAREGYVRCSDERRDYYAYSKPIWFAFYGGRTSRKQYKEMIAA